jgi:hypothetical protein
MKVLVNKKQKNMIKDKQKVRNTKKETEVLEGKRYL